MKIIITGGAGFIGSAVARHIINEQQDEILIVDKLTYAGNLENLKDIVNDMGEEAKGMCLAFLSEVDEADSYLY